MDVSTVQSDLEKAGFELHSSVTSVTGDISHLLFQAVISEKGSQETPVTKIVRYESDLEKSEDSRESIFGGKISLKREAAIYDLARKQGLPAVATWGPYKGSERDFLVTYVPEGKTWKQYVDEGADFAAMRGRHLFVVSQIGSYLAKAHRAEFPMFGDVMPFGLEAHSSQSKYSDRLSEIITHNIDNPAHKEFFNPTQLDLLNAYFNKKLGEYAFLGMPEGSVQPRSVFVLANIHRWNVRMDEAGRINYMDGFNFAQAAPAAAEFAAILLQATNTELASVEETQNRLLAAYRENGGVVDLNNPQSRLEIELLTANHFFRAATKYSTLNNQDGSPDEMRRGWATVFRDRILPPIIWKGQIDYDLNSETLNKKK